MIQQIRDAIAKAIVPTMPTVTPFSSMGGDVRLGKQVMVGHGPIVMPCNIAVTRHP